MKMWSLTVPSVGASRGTGADITAGYFIVTPIKEV